MGGEKGTCFRASLPRSLPGGPSFQNLPRELCPALPPQRHVPRCGAHLPAAGRLCLRPVSPPGSVPAEGMFVGHWCVPARGPCPTPPSAPGRAGGTGDGGWRLKHVGLGETGEPRGARGPAGAGAAQAGLPGRVWGRPGGQGGAPGCPPHGAGLWAGPGRRWCLPREGLGCCLPSRSLGRVGGGTAGALGGPVGVLGFHLAEAYGGACEYSFADKFFSVSGERFGSGC